MPTRILVAVLFCSVFLAPRVARSQQLPPPPQQAKPQTQNPANPPRAPGQRFTVGLVHLVAAVMDRRNKFVTDLTQ
ncbi:MAG: hypothetical protein WA855_18645, partial [Candidatus Acidiferrales bacterium]